MYDESHGSQALTADFFREQFAVFVFRTLVSWGTHASLLAMSCNIRHDMFYLIEMN